MIGTFTGTSLANTATWHPPTATTETPTACPTQPKQQAKGQPDTQLEQAVRTAARMRTIFYLVVLLVALTGQVTGVTQKLNIHLLIAIPAVGALELGGVVVMANADVRRRLGERAIASRILSAAIAAGAATFNWLAHDNHLLGGFFTGMSALGYLVWLMHVENVRRDRLRAIGALAATTPAYELIGHWLRHPLITRRAQSMAKANPELGLYASLQAARAALRRERRDAAIAKVLRRKIKAAVDPTTATIAVHVYDLDQIAARLADTADYDALTSLIAADLTPARIATRAERRKHRRFGRSPRPAGRPAPGTTPLPTHDDPPRCTHGEPERKTPAEAPAAQTNQTLQARDHAPNLDQPASPAQPAGEHASDEVPGVDKGTESSTVTNSVPPKAHQRDHTADDADELPPPGEPGERSEFPRETAAAVAYWLDVDPNMRYDEIAKRIGRTERTVRRNLPPGFRRPSGRGRT